MSGVKGDRPLSTPRLARLAARGTPVPEPTAAEAATPETADDDLEHCELCALALPERHRHLFDIEKATLLCACQACSTLMDHRAAGGSHYRLVPREARRIVDLELPEHRWHALGVPVELVFFVDSTPHQGVTAFFPGAMGATEGRPDPAAWGIVLAENPVVAALEPDVEALLVRRPPHAGDGGDRGNRGDDGEGGGARRAYIAPIDTCFRLTGRIRARWHGLSGGPEVFEAVEEFFQALDGEAVAVDRHGRRSHAFDPVSSTAQEVTT